MTSANHNVNSAERAASAVTGAAMVLFGLRRAGFSRLLLLTGGGMLLYRGISGHCPAYGALGLTSMPSDDAGEKPRGLALPHAEKPHSPLVIDQAITVRAPIDALLRACRDPSVISEVVANVAEVRAGADNELQWKLKVPLLDAVEFATEWRDTGNPNGVAFESAAGAPFRIAGTMGFEPAPGDWGTTVRLHVEIETLGSTVTHLASTLLGPLPGRVVQQGLRRFKSFMETGEIPTNDMSRGMTETSSEE